MVHSRFVSFDGEEVAVVACSLAGVALLLPFDLAATCAYEEDFGTGGGGGGGGGIVAVVAGIFAVASRAKIRLESNSMVLFCCTIVFDSVAIV